MFIVLLSRDSFSAETGVLHALSMVFVYFCLAILWKVRFMPQPCYLPNVIYLLSVRLPFRVSYVYVNFESRGCWWLEIKMVTYLLGTRVGPRIFLPLPVRTYGSVKACTSKISWICYLRILGWYNPGTLCMGIQEWIVSSSVSSSYHSSSVFSLTFTQRKHILHSCM